MGMFENGKIAYVEEKPDLMPGNSFPNRARLPVHGTALGEALLAYGLASNHVEMEEGHRVGQTQKRYPRTVTARVMSILSAFSKEHPILSSFQLEFSQPGSAPSRP